jgi:hypothetical protein
VKREWRENNAERKSELQRQYRINRPDIHRAHKIVNEAVRVGEIPPANSVICELCQEVQAQLYHHHNGYELKNTLDNIVAICTTCHGKEKRVDG